MPQHSNVRPSCVVQLPTTIDLQTHRYHSTKTYVLPTLLTKCDLDTKPSHKTPIYSCLHHKGNSVYSSSKRNKAVRQSVNVLLCCLHYAAYVLYPLRTLCERKPDKSAARDHSRAENHWSLASAFSDLHTTRSLLAARQSTQDQRAVACKATRRVGSLQVVWVGAESPICRGAKAGELTGETSRDSAAWWSTRL